MALDKVIDSAQLDANLTAVADAIRTKGGTTSKLEFPSGFVSAVEGIQAGGGGESGTFDFVGTHHGVHTKIITVGANTVSKGNEMYAYLQGLIEGDLIVYALMSDPDTYNQAVVAPGKAITDFVRYRNGTFTNASRMASDYDTVLVEGSKYLLVARTSPLS